MFRFVAKKITFPKCNEDWYSKISSIKIGEYRVYEFSTEFKTIYGNRKMEMAMNIDGKKLVRKNPGILDSLFKKKNIGKFCSWWY